MNGSKSSNKKAKRVEDEDQFTESEDGDEYVLSRFKPILHTVLNVSASHLIYPNNKATCQVFLSMHIGPCGE